MLLIDQTYITARKNNLRIRVTLNEFTGMYEFMIDKNSEIIFESKFWDNTFRIDRDHPNDVPVITPEKLKEMEEFRNVQSAIMQFIRAMSS